jgi:cation diffusion facilitator family transporter
MKNTKKQQYWIGASIIFNLILSIAKLLWGLAVGATVITADGIHSISDVIGALLIFLAIRFAGHKSKRFPFGMNKLEDMAAFIGGLAILGAGYGIIRTVFFTKGIKTPEHIVATLIFAAVILFSEAIFYYFERKAGKKLNSPGIKTDALNWLGDMGATVVVIAGIIASYFSIPYAQKIAVLIIILMIFYGAFEILRDASLSLMDASVDSDLLEKAKNIIKNFKEVSNIDRIYIRRSGSVFFADIVLQVKQKNIASAHNLVDNIEKELHKQIPNLAIATIHYEPEKKQTHKIAILLDESKENIAHSFGKCMWINFVEIDNNGNIVNSKSEKNPVQHGQRGKSIKLAAWLINENIDEIIIRPSDMEQDLQTLFSALGIKISENSNLLKQMPDKIS